ncbi:hypothetical protein MHI01_26140 [Paenibacillus sp. FSL M7-0656]|uniref:hypothetical protein n=1 Tax=Paenibacillus sp. FSL M7-0656 TaxID=2921534 RepID=UPI0030F4C339
MNIYYVVMGAGEAILDFKELVLTLFGVLAAILFVLIDMGLEVLLKKQRRKS